MGDDLERAHWERMDRNAKHSLHAIKDFVDYLENVKKELCLASTRLSSEEALEYIGPCTEVALTGIVHALNYLAVCRAQIQETDLVLATRSLARLETR